MRITLILSYNGTSYLGSQIQKETNNTILGQLTLVLFKLGIDSKIIASGRTDKGVHATGQVCHVDLPEYWSDFQKLKRVLNEMLPATIKVTKVQRVDDNFHARYDAKKRVYRYLLKKEDSNPFEDEFITFDKNIDFTIIQKNIQLFVGEHDFVNFMKTGSDVKSTVRTVYKAFAYRHKNLIILHFEANGFLRSQIRLMVGALQQLNAVQIKEQLKSHTIHKIRPAKSNGLYLSKIKY